MPRITSKPPAVKQPYQRPSVGRVVHYHERWNREIIGWAALIIFVHEDDSVSLTVWDPNGATYSKGKVYEGDPDERGTWGWPPRV